jgi:hypothetical protein
MFGNPTAVLHYRHGPDPQVQAGYSAGYSGRMPLIKLVASNRHRVQCDKTWHTMQENHHMCTIVQVGAPERGQILSLCLGDKIYYGIGLSIIFP